MTFENQYRHLTSEALQYIPVLSHVIIKYSLQTYLDRYIDTWPVSGSNLHLVYTNPCINRKATTTQQKVYFYCVVLHLN